MRALSKGKSVRRGPTHSDICKEAEPDYGKRRICSVLDVEVNEK